MFRNKIRKFGEDEQGVAAVESAILLPVFIPLLIGVIEVLLFVFNSNMLDTAVRDAVQEIRLGQSMKIAQEEKQTPQEYYKHAICEKTLIINCVDNIEVSLEQREVTVDAIVSTGNIVITDVSNQFIDPSSLVFIKATTKAPGIGFLSSFAGKEFLTITGAQAFVTEPF